LELKGKAAVQRTEMVWQRVRLRKSWRVENRWQYNNCIGRNHSAEVERHLRVAVTGEQAAKQSLANFISLALQTVDIAAEKQAEHLPKQHGKRKLRQLFLILMNDMVTDVSRYSSTKKDKWNLTKSLAKSKHGSSFLTEVFVISAAACANCELLGAYMMMAMPMRQTNTPIRS
jgi:hypothetical protein